jgi:FAD/FMN-containing dehydrogenase
VSINSADVIGQLQSSVSGAVIGPDDPAYDRARTVFIGGVDRRPVAIVRVADTDDVAHVIKVATQNGLAFAVRGGGHSLAGHSAIDGGLLIDLEAMSQVTIDVDNKIGHAQGGATAGRYTTEAAKHGLATGFGDTGTVGVGGITLAGGAGFLSRKHGLTIDHLVEAEVVTADGDVLTVNDSDHPELFWALRGGGGNFGVVTRFTYRLHPVTEFTGGMLILPATADVLAGFVAAAQDAPDELSTIIMTMVAPPMPFLPAEVHGQLVVLGLMAYAGPDDDADRALAPFRALATPLVDMLQPQAYTDMFEPEAEDDDAEHHPTAAIRSMFVDGFTRTDAELILDRIQAATSPMAGVQLRVLGGAISRVPVDATAYAHRDRAIMVNVNAMYQPGDDPAPHQAWVDALAAGLSGGTPGVYTGFLADGGVDRVREAYPDATWKRLVEVKRQYDPANLFRSNHNVSPDGG